MGSKIDKAVGKAKELGGHAMHKTGEALGSDKMTAKGYQVEAEGDLQQAAGTVKGAVKDAANKIAGSANRSL